MDFRPVRIFNWIAASVAAVVTFSLPAIYFAITYLYQVSALETTAEIKAHIVTEMINSVPTMWRYQDHYLNDLLERGPGKNRNEAQKIVDIDGRVVVQSREAIDPPALMRSQPLMDSGDVVGRIEISRSLRPLLVNTGLMGILGLALGSAVFITLRVFPVRALRRAQESLFREKEQAQITLRSIGDGVVTTDLSGRIVLFNKVAEDLTGWTPQEAEGRPLSEVFSDFDEPGRKPAEDPIRKVLQSGEIVDFPTPTLLASRDGMVRAIVKSGAPAHDRQGNVIGVVLVFRDVTDKERFEKEREKREKLESLGILAGGFAHDFNNILTTILGNIALAEIYTVPGDKVHRKMAEASKACLKGKELTNQLLTFSKGGAPVKKTGSITGLLEESSRFALTGSNVRCELAVPEGIWTVDVDPGQMSQVFHNLILNADQAMPDGGLIRVRAENVNLEHAPDRTVPEGTYVKISITDQGHGIPEANIRKIFDPYFTTKQKGSGLGLAISYFIIKNHGGYITVSSEPGVGTTFEIYLPASSKRVPDDDAEPAKPLGGKGRILVMDDENEVRSVVGEILSHIGYDVELAREGAEAVTLFRKALEESRPFDVVIADLTVPGGMGGKELISSLLKIDPGVRAIVSSGYSNDPVMANYRQHGFRGVVAKPYRIKELNDVVQGVLAGDLA
jgi:PAS domain S-box-containing protein